MDLNFLFLFSYFGKQYIYHKRDSENPYIDKMNQLSPMRHPGMAMSYAIYMAACSRWAQEGRLGHEQNMQTYKPGRLEPLKKETSASNGQKMYIKYPLKFDPHLGCIYILYNPQVEVIEPFQMMHIPLDEPSECNFLYVPLYYDDKL